VTGPSSVERIAEVVFASAGRRAAILGGGEPPGETALAHWLSTADVFLAADRAALDYTRLPRRPDAVIGDMDTAATHDDGVGPPRLRRDDQRTSDLEKCLHHALSLGCTEAVLLGATGRRLDHTLYNLSLVEGFADRLRICVANAHGATVRIGEGERTDWDLPAGTVFSLAPLVSPALVGTVWGARWPLDGAILAPGGGHSVSNEVAAPPLRFEVRVGTVLATVCHEAPA